MLIPARAAIPWRSIVLAGLISLIVATALASQLHNHPSSMTAVTQPLSSHGLSGLPASARGPVSAVLGANDPSYRVSDSGNGFQAYNAANDLHVRFDRSGVLVGSGKAEVGLRLRAIGYGSTLTAAGGVAPQAQSNRVLYNRSALSEWYVNGPLGIEQGFTLGQAPSASQTNRPLTLSLELTDDQHPSVSVDRKSITFTESDGRSLRYGGLLATDAKGHTLRSWLELRPGRVLLHVDVQGARYPVRIDPLIQQGPKLVGEGEIAAGRFGRSVALSADGNTALIGAPRDNNEAGAAWIFIRSGSTWVQQGEKLTGAGESGPARFGRSVALSADGETAIVGASSDNGGVGAAWVYTRSGSTWTQQADLPGIEEVGNGWFGWSVALSADGNTALIGGRSDHGNLGAAWVFARSGSTWTQQGPKLTGGEESGSGWFGDAAALSADGNSALIGGRGDGGGVGAAWVFTRSGSTWTQQGPKLTGGEESGSGWFGGAVALSAEGDTALIGALKNEGGVGAAWVFTRSGSTWTQQGEKLTSAEEQGRGQFGSTVALTSDGNTALIGAPRDNGEVGAAWVFTRSGSAWAQQGTKLTGGEEQGEGQFGWSLALSSEAGTALIGGIGDHGHIGSAWVFASPQTPVAGPPTITEVAPREGPASGGSTVTLTGTNLEDATAVKFGSENATSFTVNSEESITAITPPGTGVVDVTVTTPGGTSAPTVLDQFKFESSAGPSLNTNSSDATAKGGVLAFGPDTSLAHPSCEIPLLRRKIQVSLGKRALLKIAPIGTGACAGKLQLSIKRSAKKNRRGSKTKTTIVGTATFSVPAGKTATIILKLTSAGRSLLSAHHGQLTVTLTILKALPVPTQKRTETVHLALQKPSRSKNHKSQ